MTRRALLIYNPVARGAPRLERVRAAAGAVEGWAVDVVLTEGPGHATALAREAAARGLDAAVACGGDGTANEVANGLARSSTPLAVVRGGTANVWAKEVRVPKRPEDALELLATGERRTVDLGLAGERYFLMMAGAGFDAAVVRAASYGLKRRLGALAYVIEGLRRSITHRPVDAALAADGEDASSALYWLLLGNTRSYGGVLNVAHRARLDDGRLELYLLRKGGLLRFAWLAPRVLLRRHDRDANVRYQRVAWLDLRTPGLPVQVDGEYLCETPLTFRAERQALRVIVPAGLRSPLFGG